MMFVVFIALIYAIGFFHRFEHREMIRDLRALLPLLPLGADMPPPHDWRRTGGTAERPQLKRAFNPATARAATRYALPVLFTVVLIIVLQAYIFATAYAAVCMVKWFYLHAELTRQPQTGKGSYALLIGNWQILGEDL